MLNICSAQLPHLMSSELNVTSRKSWKLSSGSVFPTRCVCRLQTKKVACNISIPNIQAPAPSGIKGNSGLYSDGGRAFTGPAQQQQFMADENKNLVVRRGKHLPTCFMPNQIHLYLLLMTGSLAESGSECHGDRAVGPRDCNTESDVQVGFTGWWVTSVG